MKKLTSFLLCFMCVQVGWAQPSQEWLSYFSGTFTRVTDIVFDAQRECVYIAGFTGDTFGIASPGALKEEFVHGITDSTSAAEYDLFLARFDLSGNLVWATYWGGLGIELMPVMNVDLSGNIYLAGRTSSSGLATEGAHLDSLGESLLTKFDPDGHLLWSTYFIQADSIEIDGTIYSRSGSIHNLDFDASGNVYLCGVAGSNVGIGTPGTHKQK